jgi:hypothetical protein
LEKFTDIASLKVGDQWIKHTGWALSSEEAFDILDQVERFEKAGAKF